MLVIRYFPKKNKRICFYRINHALSFTRSVLNQLVICVSSTSYRITSFLYRIPCVCVDFPHSKVLTLPVSFT